MVANCCSKSSITSATYSPALNAYYMMEITDALQMHKVDANGNVTAVAEGFASVTVKVMMDGKVVAQAPLVALDDVPEAGFFKRLWHGLLMWWESI